MRDLEIRGAGSLLGEIQHGHMEQVGYDTYCKLLDDVVKQMQGIEVYEEKDVQIDLNVSSYIPEEFISDSSQKIEIYQDIALCRTEEDVQNIIDEIIDRFGSMPTEVENLIEIARIKEMCKKANVVKVSQKRDSVIYIFDAQKFNVDIVSILVKEYGNKIKFSPGSQPYVTYKILGARGTGQVGELSLNEVKEFLEIAGMELKNVEE